MYWEARRQPIIFSLLKRGVVGNSKCCGKSIVVEKIEKKTMLCCSRIIPRIRKKSPIGLFPVEILKRIVLCCPDLLIIKKSMTAWVAKFCTRRQSKNLKNCGGETMELIFDLGASELTWSLLTRHSRLFLLIGNLSFLAKRNAKSQTLSDHQLSGSSCFLWKIFSSTRDVTSSVLTGKNVTSCHQNCFFW